MILVITYPPDPGDDEDEYDFDKNLDDDCDYDDELYLFWSVESYDMIIPNDQLLLITAGLQSEHFIIVVNFTKMFLQINVIGHSSSSVRGKVQKCCI